MTGVTEPATVGVNGDPVLDAGLYIVATPIGNLEDITLRALRVLRSAAVVYAEDTRRTRGLLSAHGITATTRSIPAFDESRRISEIVDRIGAGEAVALCSDAGMPGISDPGSLTARAVREAGFDVTVIPGASALTAAIAGCGMGGGAFAFLGFPPRTPGKLRRVVEGALHLAPVAFYESPMRLAKTLTILSEVTGERRIVVARELTKMHEQWYEGTAAELATILVATPPRGECTVIIGA